MGVAGGCGTLHSATSSVNFVGTEVCWKTGVKFGGGGGYDHLVETLHAPFSDWV